MEYKLIRANENESETIFEIKKGSIKPYVQQMFGWNDDWQRQFVIENYKPQSIEFIVVEDKAVGILEINENENEIFLKNILIINAYQCKGIGSRILSGLMTRSKATNKPVKLEVLAVNKRAEKFYSRHGFKVEERTSVKVCMKFESSKIMNQV